MMPPAVKRIAFSKNSVALCCFLGFLLVNTFKTAMFNQLIVASGSLPKFADLLPGFMTKVVLINACLVVLTRTKWRFVLVGFYVLQTVYVLVNVMYYLSFQGYLHISQYIGLFSEAFDLITHAALPWDARSLFVLMDLPFLIGMLVMYPRLTALNKKYLFRPVLYGTSVLFIVYFYKWEVPVETPIETMNNAYESDVAVVKKYGLLTFNIMDLFNYNDARIHINRLNYGPQFRAPDTTDTHPNILIIQVESLDANIVNYRYKKEYVTPFLHALSGECVFFPYMLSYHLAGSTSDCEFSTLSSVEPFNNFPSIKLRNYDYPNSLLKRCVADGYSTVAFHGNRGSYFNRNFAFKKMGFQYFYDMFAMGVPEIGWGASDESVFDFVNSQMLRQKQPFFYYIITMSSHEPFIFVKPYYRNRKYDDIKDGATRNYLNSMSYVDKTLARFILQVQRACPNTVVLVYGDHTPTLPRCSYSKSMFTSDHLFFEFIPLFIITPEKTVYRERNLAASFLDIAPTVLAASHSKTPIGTQGLDLLSFPTQDRGIPFCLGLYGRKDLYKKIAGKQPRTF
jgi:lipoteichoic acid synthase